MQPCGEREMPAFLFEYEHSKLEGVQFCFQTQPVAIQSATADPTRVGALECVRMELGAPDASGRRKAQPIAGSKMWIECDMVIPAIGQSPLLELLESIPTAEDRAAIVRATHVNYFLLTQIMT